MIAIIFISAVVGLAYSSYKLIRKLFPKLFDDDGEARVGLGFGCSGISFLICYIGILALSVPDVHTLGKVIHPNTDKVDVTYVANGQDMKPTDKRFRSFIDANPKGALIARKDGQTVQTTVSKIYIDGPKNGTNVTKLTYGDRTSQYLFFGIPATQKEHEHNTLTVTVTNGNINIFDERK